MSRTNRRMGTALLAVASLAFMSTPALGQSLRSLTIKAGGETGGQDIHLLNAEVGLVEEGMGFRPVGTLGAHMAFQDGRDNWGVTPAVGLRYRTDMGATQFKVGYAFRGDDGTAYFGGTNSGLYTALETEYWGVGTYWAEGSASYNVGGNYLNSSGRLGRNVARTGNGGSLGLGAEVGYQAETVDPTPQMQGLRATHVGPVVRWQTRADGPTVQLSGGWRETQLPTETDSDWYLRAEMRVR